MVLLIVNVQGNHLLSWRCRHESAALKMGSRGWSPVLKIEPCQHGCRYIANGGALKSTSAPYNGVIREASDNPHYVWRGFWAGAARHYPACGML